MRGTINRHIHPFGTSDNPHTGKRTRRHDIKRDWQVFDRLSEINELVIRRGNYTAVWETNAARIRFAEKNGVRPVLRAYGRIFFRVIETGQGGVLKFDYTETRPNVIQPLIDGETIGAATAIRYLGVTEVELSCLRACGDSSKPLVLAELNRLRENGGQS